MRRNVLFASCLALALGTVACQDQSTDPAAPSSTLQQAGNQDLIDLALKRGLVRMPVEGRLSDRVQIDYKSRLIDGTVYECVPDAPVFDWPMRSGRTRWPTTSPSWWS